MADNCSEKLSKKNSSSNSYKRANNARIGSREKGQGFAQLRRTKAIREYKRLLRNTKERHQISEYAQKVYKSEQNRKYDEDERVFLSKHTEITSHGKEEMLSPKPIDRNRKRVNTNSKYSGAQKQYKRKQFDIEQNKKEREQEKEKRIQELQKSLERRRNITQQLMKRTKRGQPVMANQINHLLSKLH